MIDPHGVAAGASGGLVGALAPHVPENWNDKKAFQFDSLIMAEGFWGDVAQSILDFFNNSLIYGALYFVLIFLFTYFYTMITFEPESISNNLKKMGGFVPGIRPGQPTAEFLDFVLKRILPLGALFLATIALMPSIVQAITQITVFRFLIGGTSIVIVVSVILETIQRIQTQLEMRSYETF